MRKYRVLFSFLVVCFLFETCKTNKIDLSDDKIVLKWYQSYDRETQRDVVVGLKWIFLYLGADCKEENIQSSVNWVDSQVMEVQIDKLGFDYRSLLVLRSIVSKFKISSEYQNKGSLDLGRFVMEVFNKSENYYKITNIPSSLDDFISNHQFNDRYEFITAYGESCVSSGIRQFNAAQSNELVEIAYLAKEGYGKTVDEFQVKEFEVFDFMPNGQPRFAIYDLNGDLKEGADTEVSIGGKPAKCMWCHTSRVQPIISAASSIEGFERLDSFSRLIKKQNSIRKEYLRNQRFDFVVDSLNQHSLAELLYFTYEYPTPLRLRSEGLSKFEIASLEYHPNTEYQFLNLAFDSMVHRNAIDETFRESARETIWEE